MRKFGAETFQKKPNLVALHARHACGKLSVEGMSDDQFVCCQIVLRHWVLAAHYSVTRLGNFLKFLWKIFFQKSAKYLCDFMGHFEDSILKLITAVAVFGQLLVTFDVLVQRLVVLLLK